jgi:sulfonate transport system ATP-binding protein
MTSPQILAAPAAVRVRIERKQFDRVLLYSNFELTVQFGQTLVVLGPSGSGKTTLLRMISGLDREFSGEMTFAAPDGAGGVPPGYVFQEVRLFPWMSVARNIQFAASRGAVGKERVTELLYLVGLDEGVGSLYPRQLSGGMAKRVALARALAGSPVLLLLDEPFSELDAKSKFAMYESLLRYKSLRSPPLTIILVTHDIDEACI